MTKLACVVLLVALAACGGGEAASMHAPSMANHAFTPKALKINAGEVVKWVNDTDEAHTVTADAESLPDGAEYFSSGGAGGEEEAIDDIASELMGPGDTFEWSFTEPGTYRYYCIPHKDDGMVGVVVVE